MNELPEHFDSLSGASELKAELGYWPSFHDAEIIEICIRTQGISEIKVRPVKQEAPKRKTQNVIVVLQIAEIESLNLTGFYSQNIILELRITANRDGFHIDIDGTVGLSGQITAKQISVKLLAD